MRYVSYDSSGGAGARTSADQILKFKVENQNSAAGLWNVLIPCRCSTLLFEQVQRERHDQELVQKLLREALQEPDPDQQRKECFERLIKSKLTKVKTLQVPVTTYESTANLSF